jgi:thiamine biosynthesis lipoprotein
MALFDKALEAKVMSTHLLIRANLSKKLLYEAYEIAKAFEARYSAYQEHSFLSEINRAAGKEPVLCTAEDLHLFQRALLASKQTQGRFDISIGALSHGAYHFGFSNQSLASKALLKAQQRLVNYTKIAVDEKSIFLEEEGMRLDLGGIGKGYAARLIALFLKEAGATRILVDVGGEIVTEGKAFTIALRDPSGDGYVGYIKTGKKALSISTSGDYERFIDEKNHHIINTEKGASSTYYHAMTVMRDGWDIDLLDAYATALFNIEPVELVPAAHHLNVSVLAIARNGDIRYLNPDKVSLSNISFSGSLLGLG